MLLTALQLKEELTTKLKGFVDNPTVTITVTEANSYRVLFPEKLKHLALFASAVKLPWLN